MSEATVSGLVVFLNRFFRRPAVEGRESPEAYSEWEYRWGRDLVRDYLEPAGDLAGKNVLDIGCGLGGKTVAYGEAGVQQILGADISEDNIEASRRFVAARSQVFKWGFLAADAARLPLPGGAFDTVIANDAMEHFAEPEAAVREMARITRPGGAIWLFFTPHFSPLGSHLYDYIYIPWCHLLLRRRDLQGAIRKILRQRRPEADDGAIEEELTRIMNSYDNDLNHMSIRRFFRIVRRVKELNVSFKELKPAKFAFLKGLTRVPLVRELITGTVVCRLERTGP